MDDDPRPTLVCVPCTLPNGVPAKRGRCTRCRQPVWIARVQVYDVPANSQPVCIPCLLNDEFFLATEKPEMIEMLRTRIGVGNG